VVAECAGLGFGMHIHAIGDRAVTWALEAVAAAPANPRAAAPHQVAHLQIVREDDVPLWVSSRAYANCQALWACHEPQMDELNLPFLGPGRGGRQYPFAQLRDAGVPLAMGSDWPVSSADPLAAVHVAVNRRSPGSDEPAFIPGQALGLLDALHAYTAGSAEACGWGATSGRLVAGLAADVAVLSRDPFEGPPDSIADTVVDLTFAGGAPAWERATGGR
jgi:predicted amidohydrolase YtcJ